MLFVINKTEGPGADERGMAVLTDRFAWTLWTVEKGETKEPVARSPRFYASEQECRSEIATAKVRLKAARFAKVRGSA